MKIKICTYNIDNLPEELDLCELPWILKPISWVYKWIKGTTKIKINDNLERKDKTEKIVQYIKSQNFDLVGFQEDLNYHDILEKGLSESYLIGKYTGGINFDNLRWLPYPRFKCDGLGLVLKKSRFKVVEEKIITWSDSSGYIENANDKLMKKGFRYYSLVLDSNVFLDLYIVHLDADFYDPDRCPDVERDIKARKSQLNQVVEEIINKNSKNPTIVMGDFNSSSFYSWDINNIQEHFLKPLQKIPGVSAEEIIGETKGVDRIFFINYKDSINQIKPIKGYYDNIRFSDHIPFIAEVEI